jgi:hypothetical protein
MIMRWGTIGLCLNGRAGDPVQQLGHIYFSLPLYFDHTLDTTYAAVFIPIACSVIF